jgi:hypothetical protein
VKGWVTRRVHAAALLALVAAVLAGCSTVPTNSATIQITQVPPRRANDVGIEPLAPEKGATPEEIVRGFIDAAASTVRGHPIARQHLAPGPDKSWSDEAGITVISPDYSTLTTDVGTVTLTAKVVGTVDQRGVFTVGTQDLYTRTFLLKQVRGEWRILDPPDALLILQPDFERLYDKRDVFFLDPTGQRVVPDPRYLLTGEAQPTSLVSRALDGPSPALAAGVRNPLAGVQLRRAVTVSGQLATVDLTGVPTDAGPQLPQICAQLVWTLDQLPLRQVQILVDGEPVSLNGVPSVQTVGDWSSFDPDEAPSGVTGLYVDGGAVRTVQGQAAPGSAGTPRYGLTSAAVWLDARSGQPAGLAGVGPAPGGVALLTGSYGGDLAPVHTAGTLSAPTVAVTRSEVWVVADGSDILRVPSGAGPEQVSAPTLAGLGRASVLQLSPDGVRAALVVDGPAGPRLYVGTVIRASDGSVSLREVREVAPSLSQVIDVGWRDGATLLVLAGATGEQRTVPYSVGVDGWGLTAVPTAGLPSQPTSIAAAPGRPPLVSAGGWIWQLVGGTWATLLRGQEPLPGTEPFYPL